MIITAILIFLLAVQFDCKPVGIASVIHGTENDKFCPKTEAEKEKQLKAEERDDLFEGDMAMTAKLAKMIDRLNQTKQRDVIAIASMKWKSTSIPYVFDKSISDRTKEVVKSACEDYAKYTCLKCVERTNEPDYIRFFVGKGCWSYVGRQGGSQDLSLGSGCDYKGTVIHELLHALGFFHEHTRLDRDDFVSINWAALKQGVEGNFKKYAVGLAEYLNEPYDYNSIMHYPEYAFSKDDRKTITVKSKMPNVKIGQRIGLSDIDIKQIKKAYKCSDPTQAPAAPVATTTTPTPPLPAVTKPVEKTTKPTTAGPPSPPPPTKAPPIPPNIKVTTKAPAVTTPSPGATTVPPTSPQNPGEQGKEETTPSPPTTVVALTQLPAVPTATSPISIDSSTTQGQQALQGPHWVIKIKTGGAAPSGSYPSWPNDFNWNANGGTSQACNCGTYQQPCTCQTTCSCRCLQINEPKAGEEWKNNYLCHKKSKNDPGMEWSYNGPIKGKRCTHLSDPTFGKYWDDNFLCVAKESPYHFIWSSKGPLAAKDMSCVRMGIPDGPKEWKDNFLCAKKT